MAYLATLEGESETADLLDRLFDCNDVLGVMVYGAETWNKVKNFVANECSKLIALNRGNFGKFSTTYKPRKIDALDNVFGFNNELGAALLGGDGWGHFVNRCKTCAPTLGKSWLSTWSITDTFKNLFNPAQSVKWTADQALPKSASISDIAKFITGYQQTAGGINAALDIAGINDAKTRLAVMEEIERQQKEAVKAAQEEAQRQREYENAQAYAQAQQALAEAQAEAARTKKEIELSPEYQASKTSNIFLIGGLGLLALMVVMNSKK